MKKSIGAAIALGVVLSLFGATAAEARIVPRKPVCKIVSMPNVLGYTEDQALTRLRGLGFRAIEVLHNEHDFMIDDPVVMQAPAIGEMASTCITKVTIMTAREWI